MEIRQSLLSTVLCLYTLTTSVTSYKILGVFPSSDSGNYLVYSPLFRELANRDHDVTLISNFLMTNPPLTYKDISLSDADPPPAKALSFDSVISSDFVRVLFETLVSTKDGNDDCKRLMDNSIVQNLLREKQHFDVIVVEQYDSDCGLALAHKLGAPYVGFIPNIIRTWQYGRLGIDYNPSFSVHHGLQYELNPGFFSRVEGYILALATNLIHYVSSQVTDHVLLYKYLGDDLPSLESIAENTSLVLTNSHPSIHRSFPKPPNVVEVGGIHLRNARAIPEDLERFISEATHGVIYVNFGSRVREDTLPQEKLDELLATFARLHMRVLWKWDNESMAGHISSNVMIRKWLPQYDILKHERVKAFITQAGALGAQEAAACGVPVLAVPLFYDQFANAAALRDAGLAVLLPYQRLTRENILEGLNQLLDPKWQQNAKLVSSLWHDRQHLPLESAIYWIEYVARHGSVTHLRSPSIGVPSYQYYKLDVLVFLFGIALLVFYVNLKIFRYMCGCCWGGNKNTREKND